MRACLVHPRLQAYCDFVIVCAAMIAFAKENEASGQNIDFEDLLCSKALFVVLLGLLPMVCVVLVIKCVRFASMYHNNLTRTTSLEANAHNTRAVATAYKHYSSDLHTDVERDLLYAWLDTTVKRVEHQTREAVAANAISEGDS